MLFLAKIKATIHTEPISLKSIFGKGERNIKHIFLDAPRYSPSYSYPSPKFPSPPLKVENYHVQQFKKPEFSGYQYEKPSIPFEEKPAFQSSIEKSNYGPAIVHPNEAPPCAYDHKPFVYEDEYIGPAPLIQDIWASGSQPGSVQVKRHAENGRNLRIESGFLPPLVPSQPIDENGKPLQQEN